MKAHAALAMVVVLASTTAPAYASPTVPDKTGITADGLAAVAAALASATAALQGTLACDPTDVPACVEELCPSQDSGCATVICMMNELTDGIDSSIEDELRNLAACDTVRRIFCMVFTPTAARLQLTDPSPPTPNYVELSLTFHDFPGSPFEAWVSVGHDGVYVEPGMVQVGNGELVMQIAPGAECGL